MSERKTRADTSGLIDVKNQVIPDEFFAATLKQAESHLLLTSIMEALKQ